MFTRTLGQHALAAALALSVALAAGWGAWHWLALRTGPCAEAATGVYIHNLGNTLEDQTRNLSRLSQALRTGDRLVVLGSSELKMCIRDSFHRMRTLSLASLPVFRR